MTAADVAVPVRDVLGLPVHAFDLPGFARWLAATAEGPAGPVRVGYVNAATVDLAARPASKGQYGFKYVLNCSINHVVCHGVPDPSEIIRDAPEPETIERLRSMRDVIQTLRMVRL